MEKGRTRKYENALKLWKVEAVKTFLILLRFHSSPDIFFSIIFFHAWHISPNTQKNVTHYS
jgi:hypothetical protein